MRVNSAFFDKESFNLTSNLKILLDSKIANYCILRIKPNGKNMSRYVVFGNPISHSLSPQLHTLFAAQLRMTIDYQKQFVPLDQFEKTVDAFRAEGGAGANMTIPFKINAYHYADQLTDRAQLAGAVNTFIFKNNRCMGDNTDGIGFIRDLKNNGIDVCDKKILIIGSGGAARGILGEISREKPYQISIYNRTIKNVENLISDFQKCIPLGRITVFAHENNFDLIINTTNANFQTDINLELNLSRSVCYDLNYNARHHSFLMWAQKNNAPKILDGLGMLVEQGAESFFQWFGKMPETKNVIEQLRHEV